MFKMSSWLSPILRVFRNRKSLSLAAAILLSGWAAPILMGADYYVDSRFGNDLSSGTSPENAWKTIRRVNNAAIGAGDSVLFARGSVWREQLYPHSGEPGKPVTYGAYGEGPLPRIYGSRDASSPEDWVEEAPGIWATRRPAASIREDFNMSYHNGFKVQGDNKWRLRTRNGAEAKLIPTDQGFRLEVQKGGKEANELEVWGPSVPSGVAQDGVLMTCRFSSSRPFKFAPPCVTDEIKENSPWLSFRDMLNADPEPKEIPLVLYRRQAFRNPEPEASLRYLFSLGHLKSGAVYEFEILSVQAFAFDPEKHTPTDVGNIIFNHGGCQKIHRCGIKKMYLDLCKEPGDFWYDDDNRRVFLRLDRNPGEEFDSIELAMDGHIIDQANCHDVTYENLAVAYGGSHGIGGGSTARITVRNCDFYYIGGSYQEKHDDGTNVRYGNGIEFWGDCDEILVENCRIWEIFDAAITNQGHGSNETRITYRNNLIWNSEYSIEYWNQGKTDQVLIEGNTFVDAGFGWGHGQRVNPFGTHLMCYNNAAETTNFVIRNNIYGYATESCLRLDNDWRSGLTIDNNQYTPSDKPVLRWLRENYYPTEELGKVTEELGFEKNGVIKEYVKNPKDFEPR